MSEKYNSWLAEIDKEIGRIASAIGEGDWWSRSDFADTVFLVDSFRDELSPSETAEMILEGDMLGRQILTMYYETTQMEGDLKND